jgi:hypothetical protein
MQRLVTLAGLVAALAFAASAGAQSARAGAADADTAPIAANPPEPPKPPEPTKGPPRPGDGSCDCRAAGAPRLAGSGLPAALAVLALLFLQASRRSRRY